MEPRKAEPPSFVSGTADMLMSRTAGKGIDLSDAPDRPGASGAKAPRGRLRVATTPELPQIVEPDLRHMAIFKYRSSVRIQRSQDAISDAFIRHLAQLISDVHNSVQSDSRIIECGHRIGVARIHANRVPRREPPHST